MKKIVHVRKCVCGKEQTFEEGSIGSSYFQGWSTLTKEREIMHHEELEHDLCAECTKKVEDFIKSFDKNVTNEKMDKFKFILGFRKKETSGKREEPFFKGYWSESEIDIIEDINLAEEFNSPEHAQVKADHLAMTLNTNCYLLPPVVIRKKYA